MSEDTRLAIGRQGERAAAVFLASRGYRILDLNWRSGRTGEIDIVAQKDGTVVFIEVKTRRWQSTGVALEAVDSRKLAQMVRLGAAWFADRSGWQPCRFDVIGVQLRPGKSPIFEWLRDVAQ